MHEWQNKSSFCVLHYNFKFIKKNSLRDMGQKEERTKTKLNHENEVIWQTCIHCNNCILCIQYDLRFCKYIQRYKPQLQIQKLNEEQIVYRFVNRLWKNKKIKHSNKCNCYFIHKNWSPQYTEYSYLITYNWKKVM